MLFRGNPRLGFPVRAWVGGYFVIAVAARLIASVCPVPVNFRPAPQACGAAFLFAHVTPLLSLMVSRCFALCSPRRSGKVVVFQRFAPSATPTTPSTRLFCFANFLCTYSSIHPQNSVKKFLLYRDIENRCSRCSLCSGTPGIISPFSSVQTLPQPRNPLIRLCFLRYPRLPARPNPRTVCLHRAFLTPACVFRPDR